MVTMSEPLNAAITVQLTSAGTATVGHGTNCVGPVDILFDNQQVTFPPNDTTSRLIRWNVCRDARDDEDTERMVITLSQPTGGAVIDQNANTATITITDDDPSPGINIGNLSITEPPESGASVTGNVTIALSAPSNRQVTMSVSAEEVPSTSQRYPFGEMPALATKGFTCVSLADFIGGSQQVAIPVSNVSITVPVKVCGDRRREGTRREGARRPARKCSRFMGRPPTMRRSCRAQGTW
jgi:hypothetical protein